MLRLVCSTIREICHSDRILPLQPLLPMAPLVLKRTPLVTAARPRSLRLRVSWLTRGRYRLALCRRPAVICRLRAVPPARRAVPLGAVASGKRTAVAASAAPPRAPPSTKGFEIDGLHDEPLKWRQKPSADGWRQQPAQPQSDKIQDDLYGGVLFEAEQAEESPQRWAT